MREYVLYERAMDALVNIFEVVVTTARVYGSEQLDCPPEELPWGFLREFGGDMRHVNEAYIRGCYETSKNSPDDVWTIFETMRTVFPKNYPDIKLYWHIFDMVTAWNESRWTYDCEPETTVRQLFPSHFKPWNFL